MIRIQGWLELRQQLEKYAFKPFPGRKTGVGIFVSSFYADIGFIAINSDPAFFLKIASYLMALVTASIIGYQTAR